MRVLLITDSYPPEIRSASLLMAEMAQALQARGFEVGVLTSTPRYNLSRWPSFGKKRPFYRERIAGIEVLRVHTLPIHNVGHIRRGIGQLLLPGIFALPSFFLKKPDAAIIYSPPLTLGLAAYFMKMLRGTKIIFNVQDIFPQNAIDLGALRDRRIITAFRKIERFIYRHADFITVHSQANRASLVSAGAPGRKVKVIPNWIDTSLYRGERGPVPLADPSQLEGKFTVLFAGVMGYAQDLEIVLETAGMLNERDDNLFLLVGGGSERKKLEDQVARMGLGKVRFHAFVQLEHYPDLVRAADCGLVTLRKTMQTPVVPSKILGYLAAGIPVVGSLNQQSEGIGIIEDSGGGFAAGIDSAEALAGAIKTLADDRERARAMGAAGKAYIEERFGLDRCLDQYEQLLRELG